MKLKERRPSAALFGGWFIPRRTDEPSHINAYYTIRAVNDSSYVVMQYASAIYI